MAEVFPRRDLGAAENWGRTVENHILDAEKKWLIQSQSVAGAERSSQATLQSLGEQLDRIQGVRDSLPITETDSVSDTNFALADGWQTVASLVLPASGKSRANVMAYGTVSINDQGSGGGPGLFIWPFDPSLITSEFGPRDGRFHEGTDFAGGAASAGNNIVATSGGTVITSGWHSDWGWHVIIDHGVYNSFQLYTHYAHMQSSPAVGVGAGVVQSQVIGQVGNTGLSFGAHLHYETHMTMPGAPLVWDPDNPSYGSDRTSVNVRDFMDIYGDAGSVTYDLGMRCRLRIGSTNSRNFHPYRNTFVPPDLPNSFYPVFGRAYNLTVDSVTVQLQVFTTNGIAAQSANRAVLTAEGIFS